MSDLVVRKKFGEKNFPQKTSAAKQYFAKKNICKKCFHENEKSFKKIGLKT